MKKRGQFEEKTNKKQNKKVQNFQLINRTNILPITS